MKFVSFFLTFITTFAFAAKPKLNYVRVKAVKGECVIMLYNQTPKTPG